MDFLTWLADQNLTLADSRQPDVDLWLETGPAASNLRDFLHWAEHKQAERSTSPHHPATTAAQPNPNSAKRGHTPPSCGNA